MTSDRIAVFIDNSNTFHYLSDLRKIDPKWVCLYNPLTLAQKLAGQRNIVYIGFYCVRPPSYLLKENGYSQERYKKTMQYYDAIEKMPKITIKYGSLKGSPKDITEKNLDTKISTDLVKMGALNEYDVAVLVSNDGDYVSPVESVKDSFKKRVEVAYFKGKLSMNLRKVCDLGRRLRQSYFKKLNF